MTPTMRDVMERYDLFAGTFLKIRDKNQNVVTLLFNPAQAVLWAKTQEMIKAGLPPRMVILKARQVGISTFVQGYTFWRAMRPNTSAVTVAHDLESTTRIFEMSKFFYENLPPGVRPMKRYSSRKELVLENPDEKTRPLRPGLRSRLEVRTAGNVGSGKGYTIHVLHASECAMYQQPELVWSSLTPAVPYTLDSAIFLESTAHIMGAWFRDFWYRSKSGETGYTPVFLPWTLMPEYALTNAAKDFWLAVRLLSEDERDLMGQFGLSTGQIAWRRMKIDEVGSEALFRQDFPLTDEEAFIAIGSPLIPHETIEVLRAETQPGTWGEIIDGRFVPMVDGRFEMWEPPQDDATYTTGVDTSQGTEASNPACAQTIRSGPIQVQVGVWHGKMDPIDFAKPVEAIGRFYNEALVAVETNSAGISTQRALMDTYSGSLYRWRYIDKAGSGITQRFGWYTSSSSKPTLIAHLRHVVMSGKLKIRDPETVEELKWFVLDGRGGAAAAPGHTDDRVMALAIASICDTLSGGEAGWSERKSNQPLVPSYLDPIRHDTLPGLDEGRSWKSH